MAKIQIAIEGFDGVGKSTLGEKLSKHLHVKTLEKPLKLLFNLDSKQYGDAISIINKNDFVVSSWFHGLNNLLLQKIFFDDDFITYKYIASNYVWSYQENSKDVYATLKNHIWLKPTIILLVANKQEITDRLKHRNKSDKDLAKINFVDEFYVKIKQAISFFNFNAIVIDTNNKNAEEVFLEVLSKLTL